MELFPTFFWQQQLTHVGIHDMEGTSDGHHGRTPNDGMILCVLVGIVDLFFGGNEEEDIRDCFIWWLAHECTCSQISE